MAYRDRTPLQPELPTGCYNLNRAVGPGAPNRPDDVMLVQLLLKKVYARNRGLTVPPGRMVVDGFFGPITHAWIRQFQRQAKFDKDCNVALDGVVDRYKGNRVSSISKTVYTILHLNGVIRKDDPGTWEALEDDPDCPLALGQQLLFNGPG
jgi:peptidoglycan hydrolase-like protein with peptidoglycan-binding domain